MKQLGVVVAVLFALCVAGAGAWAAPQEPANVRVRVKGQSSVVVTERGRARTLDLKGQIDAMRIEEASALFLSRAGGFTYLVLDVCGLSKVPPGNGMCGAGTECNVVWLKLDGAWRVRDAKNERYESCWAPITSEEGPKVQGRRMTFTVEDLREEVRREVTYDADNPEAGLTVKQTPILKSGQNHPR